MSCNTLAALNTLVTGLNRIPVSAIWFWSPLAVNGMWFVLTLVSSRALEADEIGRCYAITIVCSYLGLTSLGGLLVRELPERQAISGCGIQAVLLLVIFAGLYRDMGLQHGAGLEHVRLITGLYYSIVTWTTLGYGDYTPPISIQMVAATEALMGYIYMGVLVGVMVVTFDRRRSGAPAP